MTFETEKEIEKFGAELSLDLSVFDQLFLKKVIHNRMNVRECSGSAYYLEYINKFPDELEIFKDQLSNSHSEFFRNPFTFSLLENVIFPDLIRSLANNKSREIRIWSAGCAAGQEPYSLAILLDHLKNSQSGTFNSRIFATDHLSEQLTLANKGVYEFNSVRNIRLELIKKYFSKQGDSFVLNKQIKDQVDFSEFDLHSTDTKVPPSSIYGDFDLVICSNVLFYYCDTVQKEILAKFQKSLKPGGIMVTGEAEYSILNSHRGFKQLFKHSAIYQKC